VEKENPYSPPTTAAVMSPHPPNYIMHAGHTPLATQSRSARSSFISDLTESQELFAPQPPLTAQLIQGHGDSDLELKSPKMLPTEPGDINVMLEALESRLQVVSENPEENKPEALKKAEATSDEDDDDDESGTAVTDSPGGIKLKSGRRMNFGAQLGAMG